MTIQSAIRTDNLTTRHAGFARVFQPGRLTFGFIAPLEGYPDLRTPTMRDHLAIARKADDAGFAAVWLRDVPFASSDDDAIPLQAEIGRRSRPRSQSIRT